MKKVRSLGFVLALGIGSLVAVGCGGSVENSQTQARAAAKAPLALQTHGVVKMLGEALSEVSLRPEQRTELETLADARHAAMADGKKDLMLALADQIEKGSIDKAALQPKIDRIVADLEKGRPDDTAALARMHAILDPEQRNQFVDALESEFKGKHGRHHNGGAENAEGEVSSHGGMHGLKKLAEDLKLTDEQRSQIKDALRSGREGHSFKQSHQRMGARKQALESFRTDTFEPTAVTPVPETLRAQAAIGSGRFLGLAEKVVPLLTPEQRKLAAEKVRAMAQSGADVLFRH